MATTTTAREVRVTAFGMPATLSLETVPVPTPGADEVVVQMRMAPVNPAGERAAAHARLALHPGVARCVRFAEGAPWLVAQRVSWPASWRATERACRATAPHGSLEHYPVVSCPARSIFPACSYRSRSTTTAAADIFSLMGVYPGAKMATPAVPGLEGMGVVAAVGADVADVVHVGQRVVPLFIFSDAYLKAGRGSWADFVVFKAAHVCPVPDGVSDEAAAQFVVNPWTAYAMLKELNAPAGAYVVQTAAGSVLGRQLIQMARHLGLRTINIVRRAEAAAELKALGADEVLVHGADDIAARVRKLTGGAGAWGGVDCVGAEWTATVTSCVRNGGTVFVYGAMSGLQFTGSIVDLTFRDVALRGFWITPFISTRGVEYCHRLAAEVWPLLAAGVVTPYTGDVFPLERVAEAVAASTAAGRGGKVLLRM